MKHTNQPTKNSYVLVSVLVIMTVMLVITYYLSDVLFSEIAISRNQKSASVTFNLAEAGVEEAIWRIQNDTSTKDTFLNSINGSTTFSHNPGLLPNSSYTVTIQNTARGAANITSTGLLSFGVKQAQRKVIARVTQATTPPPYDSDGAFFSASDGGQSTGDLEFTSATVNVYGGSIHSGRDISFKWSTINAETGIKAERNVHVLNSTINCNCQIAGNPDCNINPGCIYSINPSFPMPMIDFDSSSAYSYKNQAISQNQYFNTMADFYNHFNFLPNETKTINGVVYIENDINIDEGKTLNMNGVLATSGSIAIGSNTNGTLNLTRPDDNTPAGGLAKTGFSINRKGNLTGTGLIYSGFRADIQSSNSPITFTGGMMSRRIYFNAREVNLHFYSDVINDTLANPTTTPVILISHWEEEY